MIGPRGRLVAFYVTNLGSLGCVPYFAVLLEERGFDGPTVATAMVAIPVGVLVGGPLWGAIADATGSPIGILRVSTLLTVAVGIALAATRTATEMAVVMLLWSLARSPHAPIADGLTVEVLGDDRRSYGRFRAAGSTAFLVVAWICGVLHDAWPQGPLVLSALLVAASSAVSWGLPDTAPRATRARPDEIVLLATTLWPWLLVTVLHGSALVCFDVFWSLHVKGFGWPSWYAGTGVALAVAVEVGILVAGRGLLDRFGSTPLLGAAMGAGALQWALASVIEHPAALVALQAIRGVAFGAFWIAVVSAFSERAPRHLGSTAQALAAAAGWGVGYLACMALARAALESGDTGDLFLDVAGVEIAALVILAAVFRR